MYRGYQLDLEFSNNYYDIGVEIFRSNRSLIKESLDLFFSSDNTLNGTEIANNWFPQVEADIFISHSHRNKKMCISFAGWLYSQFQLVSFLDSCIWGYVNDLLWKIDNLYTIQRDGYFNYEERNRTTSHVNMMLSMAIMKMIDSTECFFVLNKPDSLKISESVSQTFSPWVYAEILMSRLIRPKSLKKHPIRNQKGILSKAKSALFEDIEISYEVDLNHLTEIDKSKLNQWKIIHKSTSYPLDTLYSIT